MKKEKVVFYKSDGQEIHIEAQSIIVLSLDSPDRDKIGNMGIHNAVSDQNIATYMVGELLAFLHTLRGPGLVLEVLRHYMASVEEQEEGAHQYYKEGAQPPKGKIVYHYRRGGSDYCSEMPSYAEALDCAQWDYEQGGALGNTDPIKIVMGDQEYSLSTLIGKYSWGPRKRREKPGDVDEISTNSH